jgi:hypothetical protein
MWFGRRGFKIALIDILNLLCEESSPFLWSLLSTCVRSAPYADYDSVEETLQGGIEKEIAASVNKYRPKKMDYKCMFSDNTNHRSAPLYEGIPGDPIVANSLYSAFCHARTKLYGSVLWPDVGMKTVGDQVSEEFWTHYWLNGQGWKTDMHVTCGDLERLYAETGTKIGGPVEMRSAWRYNELKPRIYFARGGKTFHSSKYVQAIFNTILESFPEVAKVDRYLEPSIIIAPNETSVIYDYESFTSSLEEIKNFTAQLALFMGEVEVTIIDSESGPMQTTVGEILWQYNLDCNTYAEFDAEKLVRSLEFRQLFHTCGMLGVPGNISSCTLLHGILIRFIAGIGKGRSVGDDGKMYVDLGADHQLGLDQLFRHIQTIGRLQPTKVFDFKHYDIEFDQIEAYSYQFIKLPYRRIDCRMLSGTLYVLPNPFILLAFQDKYHVHDKSPESERLKKYGKGLARFLMKFTDEDQDIIEADEARIHSMISATRSQFYKRFVHGNPTLPRFKHFLRNLDGPEVELAKFDIGEFILAKYDLDDEIYMQEEIIDESKGLGYAGEEWLVGASSLLSWMQCLGYVEARDRYIVMTRRRFGDDYLKEVFQAVYKTAKDVYILHDLPDWLRYICSY